MRRKILATAVLGVVATGVGGFALPAHAAVECYDVVGYDVCAGHYDDIDGDGVFASASNDDGSLSGYVVLPVNDYQENRVLLRAGAVAAGESTTAIARNGNGFYDALVQLPGDDYAYATYYDRYDSFCYVQQQGVDSRAVVGDQVHRVAAGHVSDQSFGFGCGVGSYYYATVDGHEYRVEDPQE